ncbi:GH15 family glucan-1,4-alpha-glucosidase [Motilibacter peucedani]|uniref:GH15 family glucan-1,4-alpha-glucosidase n=1 Tax=Motilibacter peucedani TaxID=598650 RepID=A0A420XSG1_9ACTN|nr:glycoside hydrolase family 15 protein [Motilibacter peucedani]RKS77737.1 GH15 family glucan-1,4-alpha-glucosidase [Motilibacter peucedani]
MSDRRRPRRVEGYAPVGDYSGIGDGRSVALVALDGAVDWWPLPDLNSPPAFAALLDPAEGGAVLLHPVGEFEVERRYLEGTNVVETVFTTPSGSVRVTDAVCTGVAGRLPWSELARRVEGLDGEVEMAWEVAPGTALGTLSPWSDADGLLHLDDLTIGVRTRGVGEPVTGPRSVSGRWTATAGATGVLAVVATEREPLPLPPLEDVEARIERTAEGWRDWSRTLHWDGPWEADVRRSALALKLLVYAPSGALAAAATTSLPERPGGTKNWDYRYSWVRDAAYTLDAFVRMGLDEEIHASLAWLLATVDRHGPQLRPFYALDGSLPSGSHTRDVPGYLHSRPVTYGNDAAEQLQLGPYGDLFQMVFLCVQRGHVLDLRTRRRLAALADRCCDLWQRRDAGIWELHDEQHYTLSKMSCWQALDRACRLADLGQLEGDSRRWAMEADRVRAWVEEHCWSEARQSYTFYAGSDALDAGVLLGARYGFDRDERMRSTVEAVLDELGEDPFVYRYSGMREEEAAFLACSFWTVEALALTGSVERAASLMERTLERTRSFGLLAEMVDPATGEAVGNTPQALSHLALVNAASAVQEARDGEV